VKGRKRHVLVDVLGLILALVVHPADVQDPEGGKQVLAKVPGVFPHLLKIWADGRYAGKFLTWAFQFGGWWVEVVNRPKGAPGFVLLKRRWIVERTFAWLENYHRLSKDHEALPESSENLIYLAMIHVMVRRLRPA
jgi:putative transposase